MELTLQIGYDILYLSSCVLRHRAPDPDRVQKMDLAAVFKASKKQNLEAITYAALEGMPQLTGTLAEQWKQCSRKALRKEILFDVERDALEQWMEESGIWYLPLKGCILKSMYPQPGIRQMSDNDILFDPAYQKQVQNWFVSRGYTATATSQNVHDVYQKAPVLNFEMHVALFDRQVSAMFGNYWTDAAKRAIPMAGKNYGLQMRPEEFYLFIICHSYRHFEDFGSGLRILLDLYVLMEHLGSTLNWDEIHAKLDQLGLSEFEAQLRNLQQTILGSENFCPDMLSDHQKDILSYMLGSGTYGTMSVKVDNQLKQIQGNGKAATAGTKLRYYYRRLFPDQSYFNISDKMMDIYNHPLRRWWYMIKRIFKAVFKNHRRLKKEIGYVEHNQQAQ